MEGLLDPDDFLGMLKEAAKEAEKSTHDIMGKIGLKSKIGDSTKSDKYAKELEAIYVKSLTRILKIVNKLELGPVTDGHFKTSVEENLPDENASPKYFEIGDRVKIGCSRRDFKYIQKRVPAWKKTMANLYEQKGIVTDQHTKKDIVVQVYFPAIYSSCAIHTAVLKKDETFQDKETTCTPWKVGDFVQTSSHERVVKQLMLRLPDVPKKYYGVPGKVIAVTTAGIFVTYDGLRSYCIDSALLRKADRDPVIKEEQKSHEREFKAGGHVKVISHLKTLIENQKGNGGWNRKMCEMAGKRGYVTDINGDGTIDVCTGFSRGWRMNAESIINDDLSETEPNDYGDDLELLPGDIVRLNMTNDIRMHLLSKNIPLIFLEYLMVTGVVDSVDDDFDAWTRFNSTGKICLQNSSLVKVSNEERRRHEEIAKEVSQIKVGSEVYLDVGPPNYVRAILADHCRVDSDIGNAIMERSKVVGWTDAQHAVIECKTGKCYRINKKYLTILKRFDVVIPKEEEFNLQTVEKLRKHFFDIVEKIHSCEETDLLKKDFSVDIFSMSKGRPPAVELRIRSTIVENKKKEIFKHLNQLEWKVENRWPIIEIRKAGEICTQHIRVGLLFNDDAYVSSITVGTSSSDRSAVRQSDKEKKTEEAAKVAKPEIKSLDQFEFLTLRNKTLSRAVYFPYLVYGPAHKTEEPDGSSDKTNSETPIKHETTINFNGSSIGSCNILAE